MAEYIDGFAFPIPKKFVDEYKKASEKVAAIWKEYGTLSYSEYIGDDLNIEGVKSFLGSMDAKEEETVIFGWAVFESKEARDRINEQVSKDPRMGKIVGPLMDPARQVFDPSRMAYGGFQPLIKL
jgi:uncharacterized protein YbaA (DUF1428 family)